MIGRIELRRNGQAVSVSVGEFLELPLGERVETVLNRRVRFFSRDGNELDMRLALRTLRDMAAATSTAPPHPHE